MGSLVLIVEGESVMSCSDGSSLLEVKLGGGRVMQTATGSREEEEDEFVPRREVQTIGENRTPSPTGLVKVDRFQNSNEDMLRED